jgi:hypothetical protein
MKEQLSILWSGLWRLMIGLAILAALIFLGVWFDPWGPLLVVLFIFMIGFSYLIGLSVHGK